MSFLTGSSGGPALSLFASRRSFSAATAILTEEVDQEQPGSDGSGFEISREPVVERLAGLRFTVSPVEGILAGCTYYRAEFDRTLYVKSIDGPTRSWAEVAGIDALGGVGPLHLFSEVATSFPGHVALLVGGLVTVSGSTTVAFTWRDYSPGFFNPHAGGMGENGLTRNERGFTAAWEIHVSPSFVLRGLLGQYRFPSGTADNPLSRGGSELAVGARAVLREGAVLSLRVSREVREEPGLLSELEGRMTPAIFERASVHARLSGSIRIHPALELDAHVEGIALRREQRSGEGGLFCQQVTWHAGHGLQVTARMSIFEKDARIPPLYQLESDLPGVSSSVPISGSGRRWYVLLRWIPRSWIRISVKHSVTESDVASERPTGPPRKTVKGVSAAQVDLIF